VNSPITWIILIIVAYLLGSIPLSYLVARSRGIDLRKYGTHQVGGGNLFRTTSRTLGLMVGIFDFFKGMLMVLIAWRFGMDAGQQLAVGLAAMVGHNWPVFLRFHGGRGIATSIGVIIIMPLINNITPWATVAFIVVLVVGAVTTRSTPVPILIGMILIPIICGILRQTPSVTFGFLAMVLLIIIKRLTAQPATEARTIGMGRLLWNRLLYDRDIGDRKAWVHRRHVAKKEQPGDGG
jgi:glycerol-3-phosphate acyltransferase PlsY